MAAPATANDFLELARKSGVLDDKQVAAHFPDQDDLPADPQACANALIKAGLLTPFQARQILAGKFRGFVLGAYKVLRPIGQGGMGTVYLGEHTGLKRQVALKVLPTEKAKDKLAIERFYREARAAAALDHPNIVRLHDVNQGAGVHFLVMEYVEGKDLQSLMADTGPLHFAQAVHYVAQAAAGLLHAHDKGFVHRDIKPANLIVNKDGTVKILDMGLARSFLDAADNLTGSLGNEGEAIGTADFISPEQALGQPVDERCDIYSLGVTLFALITGHPPFKGTTAQVLMQHQMAEMPRLSKKLKVSVPPALNDVIAKMMAKKKADRYQSAADVIDALSPWLPATPSGNIVQDSLSTHELRVAGVPTKKTRPRQAEPTAAGRRKKLMIGAAVGAVVVIGGLIAALLPGTPAPASPPPRADVLAAANPAVDPAANPPLPPAPPSEGRFTPLPIARVGTATTDRPLFNNSQDERYVLTAWGRREVNGVPFHLADPQGGRVKNVVLLNSTRGDQSAAAPAAVAVPVNRTAGAIHFLGGVGAWAWPWKADNAPDEDYLGKVAMTVRLRYADGATEDHPWRNGEHVADYIKRVDVPGSEFAFQTDTGRQVRSLTVVPRRAGVIRELELIKGEIPELAPVVFAVTVEGRSAAAPPAPAAGGQKYTPGPAAGDGQKYTPVPLASYGTATTERPLFLNHREERYVLANWGHREVNGVPFQLADPRGGRVRNVVVLKSRDGDQSGAAPAAVSIPVGRAAGAVHFLGGIGAWAWPFKPENAADEDYLGKVAMTVRIRYADGQVEDHPWRNGEQVADYIRRHDVPGSEFAFLCENGHQVRFLTVTPRRTAVIREVELIKGELDELAPVVMAMTVEAGPAGGATAPPPATSPAGRTAPAPAPPAGQSRGAFIPIQLGSAATAVSTKPIADPANPADVLALDDWSPKTVDGVPFELIDPKGDRPNAVVLYGDGPAEGAARGRPRSVKVPCFVEARAIHLLAGAAGAYPALPGDQTLVTVRIHYPNGTVEEHALKNGVHMAGFDRAVEVSGAASGLGLRHDRQLRHVVVRPTRPGVVTAVELVKAADRTVPVVLALTVETP